VYVDNDVSAADPRRRRPEYERLLGDVKDGRIDAVVVWDLDRLHRRPIELERFFETADAVGLRCLASVGGDVDLESGQGVLVARIKGAVAAEEVSKIRQRVLRKHRELAEAGKVGGGGTRPFGFEADRRTVRADEAEVIRELVARLLAGESTRSLCVELAERGVRTPAGKPWKPSPLRRMLVSARISGQREHRGEIVGAAEWDAIVSPEDTAKLRVMAADRAGRARRAPRRYLLAGLVVCGRCGAEMVARPRQDGSRRYVCAKGPGFVGCNGTMILAEPLEALVTEAVLLRLDSPDFAAALAGRDDQARSSGAAAELTKDEDQLQELAEAYGERLITLREFLAARTPIEGRIHQARKQLSYVSGTAALAGFVGDSGRLREEWATMTIARRQAVVAALVDRLVIGAGVRGFNRFDPDRVSPVWKA
jgi:DNA invertase Pin-like site-specific DNA recombinase